MPSAKHQVAKDWCRRIIAVAAKSRLTPAAARAKVDSKRTVSSVDAARRRCAFAPSACSSQLRSAVATSRQNRPEWSTPRERMKLNSHQPRTTAAKQLIKTKTAARKLHRHPGHRMAEQLRLSRLV